MKELMLAIIIIITSVIAIIGIQTQRNENYLLKKQLQIEKLRSEKYYLMYKLHHQIEAMPFNEWNKKKKSVKNVTIK